jgi:cell division protein FtsW
MSVARARERSNETLLLAVTGALLLVGITMVYSSTFVIAHNDPSYGNESYFLARQMVWALLGLVAMAIAAQINYRFWRRISLPIFAVALVGLVAVLIPQLGRTEFGAQRWLAIGPLPAFQPSEFAKLAVAMYFSDWLARKGSKVRDLAYGAVPFAIVLGILVGLVLLQPDLGTTIVIVAIAVSIYFIAGANLLHLAFGMALGAVGLVVAITSAGYRSQRFAAFLDPHSDPLGIGWHIIQTQIALGSGGLFGRGLGASRQKFYYLPSAPTDTIFAIIGEELGFVGAVVVILLFALLAYCGARIALQCRDLFGTLLAAGITTWLATQVLINIAVVAGVLPFTGIPLPLVSLGGSSLVISLAAVGILLSIARHSAAARAVGER